MKGRAWNILVPVLLLALTLGGVQPALADRGEPGSPEFGMGALVYPQAGSAAEAVEHAARLKLDWIRIPVAWAELQPDPGQPPRFESLQAGLRPAAVHGIAVLVSLSAAPEWALGEQGPDAGKTALFVDQLLREFPGVKAVELFPGANTLQGWGRPPSAPAYAGLFQAVREQASRLVFLVAAGLQPVSNPPLPGDVDDILFLQELYAQGAAALMPVISIQYREIDSDLARFPGRSERRTLRHYEEVRQVMLANQHSSGKIWITYFRLPSSTMNMQDSPIRDIDAQIYWMSQAYSQMRSQLYIGVAFLQSINYQPEGAALGILSLMQEDGQQHPFYAVLQEMIDLNRVGSPSIKPGRAKDGSFSKKRP